MDWLTHCMQILNIAIEVSNYILNERKVADLVDDDNDDIAEDESEEI